APRPVGPRHADVLAAKAEAGARAHRGSHLPAAQDAPIANLHLRKGAERLRIAGQQVDEVHRVGADADDVPAIIRYGHEAGVYRVLEFQSSRVLGFAPPNPRTLEPQNLER